MNIEQVPIAKAAMLIRRPVDHVFEAFIDPAITTKFWFTKSSGRLEAGKQIRWDWEMYGVHAQVTVKTIEPNQRIVIEWPTTAQWVFKARADNTTFVSITEQGFSGTPDEMVEAALGSTAGFTMVLCGLKAFLEHNIALNLVADRFADGER